MPDYVPEALKRFKRERPHKLRNSPHASATIIYGAKQQYAKEEVEEEELDAEGKLFIQQVLGTFLYYGRAVDSTMLVALSSIATYEAHPTKTTLARVDHFLDYAATHPKQL